MSRALLEPPKSGRGWYLDAKAGAFVFVDGDFEYDVDLVRCGTAAEIFGWIAHLAEKPWCSHDMLGGFVALVCEVLDVRREFGSGGTRIDVEAAARLWVEATA